MRISELRNLELLVHNHITGWDTPHSENSLVAAKHWSALLDVVVAARYFSNDMKVLEGCTHVEDSGCPECTRKEIDLNRALKALEEIK
jgi:hypothetical protein